jgi:hypothetical protein
MPQKVLPRLYFSRNGALNSDRVFANVIPDYLGDETAQGGAIGPWPVEGPLHDWAIWPAETVARRCSCELNAYVARKRSGAASWSSSAARFKI